MCTRKPFFRTKTIRMHEDSPLALKVGVVIHFIPPVVLSCADLKTRVVSVAAFDAVAGGEHPGGADDGATTELRELALPFVHERDHRGVLVALSLHTVDDALLIDLATLAGAWRRWCGLLNAGEERGVHELRIKMA